MEADNDATRIIWPWKKWRNQIANILKEVKNVEGDFAEGGQLKNAPYTTLAVEGAGKVTFPIYEEKAADIIKVCEQAPFGRKTETIVDTSVRNSWQLSPTAFKVLNPQWESYVSESVLPLVSKGLGIQTPIKSTLYKLLLYQTGSFFKTHRDSEKEDRMFGTLIIQLPSEYEGGQLIVKHGKESLTFDFSSNEPDGGKEFCTFYSTFYCDCEHEVLPVTSGYRACLVYNLISVGTDTIPIAPELYNAKMKLIHLLNLWPAHKLQKIVCSLAHQYTPAGLSFHDLKGYDQTIVKLFTAAASECPVILHLALVWKYETGGGYCDEYSGECDVQEDTIESEFCVNNWVALDDSRKKYGKFAVDVDRELIPKNCFHRMSPDKEDISERTGNEGATVERWYQRAAVVLWPRGNWDFVEASAVPKKIAFEAFLEYIKENHQEAAVYFEAEFQSCFEWVSENTYRMLAAIDHEDYEAPVLKIENCEKAFRIITGLGNLKIFQKFLELYYKVTPSSIALLLQQCEKFGWKNLHPQLKIIMQREKEPVDMLLQFMGSEKLVNDEQREVCEKLFNTLLADRPNPLFWGSLWGSFWTRDRINETEIKEKSFFKSIFDVCIKGQFKLEEFLKSKDVKYRVNIAAPALAELCAKSTSVKSNPFWNSLTRLCLNDLEPIVAVKLEAPTSWRRNASIACSQGDCSRLKSFLVMDRETTTLNVAKNRRRHIESHVRELEDVTCNSTFSGNRVDIIVRKNRGQYEEKLKEIKHAEGLLTILKTNLDPASSDGELEKDQPVKKVSKLDEPVNGMQSEGDH